MHLLIKNMVCPRCVQAVENILQQQQLIVRSIELGKAEVISPEAPIDLGKIDTALRENGFELLQDRDQQLVERVKNALLDYLYQLEKEEAISNPSDYLSQTLNTSYSHLSKLFSQFEQTTIEKYLIHLKIERVKELLSYNELTLSEIAYRLQYSSPQHLSGQFKKITGMTVSEFKMQPFAHRHSLDAL